MGEYRGTGVWDIRSKAEVFSPLEENWGMVEFRKMPLELQARFARFRETQMLLFNLDSFQFQTRPIGDG